MIQEIEQSIPFPIFRKIIKCIGLLPRLDDEIIFELRHHFKKRYCEYCGEYITSRRRIIHISCRNRYMIPKYCEPEDNFKNYSVEYVSLNDIGHFGSRLTKHMKCPVLFYSTQPKYYYRIIIQDKRKKKPISFRQMKRQQNVYMNPKFCVIPHMFCHELIPYLKYPPQLRFYLTSNMVKTLPKDRMMEKFKVDDVMLIFEWISFLEPECFPKIHIKYFPSLYSQFICHLHPSSRIRISRMIGFRKIMNHHNEWFQQILYENPKILETLSELEIKQYFNKHRDWFLSYVKQQPNVLKYITLY